MLAGGARFVVVVMFKWGLCAACLEQIRTRALRKRFTVRFIT